MKAHLLFHQDERSISWRFFMAHNLFMVTFQIFIFISFAGPARGGNEDFPWELFLPSINATTSCNSKNLSLCMNVYDCYKNSGYWYSGKCNNVPTNSKILKYIIIDGEMIQYRPNDSIFYKGNIFGNISYNSSWSCYQSPINLSGSGKSYFTASPLVDENLPKLTRQTVVFNISSMERKSIYDFAQDNNGTVSVYYDPEYYYHNYPNGAIWTKSPLKIGTSWSFEYYTTMDKDDEYKIELYYHKGNYSVISKEIVNIEIGTFETFKIYYSYQGERGNSYSLYKEDGHIWYYPKIGIIKADLNIGSYISWPCFSNYKLKYEMTGSNLLKNNLPRE